MIYFYYGDEEYAITQEINKLKQSLSPEMIDMNYKKFDNPSFADLVAVIRTPAMMFGKMLIVINCEKYFTSKKSENTTADDKLLKQIADAIEDNKANPNVDIVFRVYIDTSESRNKSGIDKRRKIFKILSACNNIKECLRIPGYKIDELKKWVLSQCKNKNIKMTPDIAEEFVIQIGNNLRLLDTELDKLNIFSNGKSITKEIVQEICTTNEDIFEFIKLLINGKKIEALDEYHKLLAKKVPLEIIGATQTMIGSKIQIKVKSQRHSLDDLSKLLKMHPYRLQLELNELKKISTKLLIKLKQNLTNAEYKIRAGKSLDPEKEIEYAILQ